MPRPTLYLYRISQDTCCEYGSYMIAVVCAASEDEARMMDPGGDDDPWFRIFERDEIGYIERTDWAPSPDLVKVELIGTAAPGIVPGVLCAQSAMG